MNNTHTEWLVNTMKRQYGEMKPRAMLGVALIVLAILLFLNNIGFRLLGVAFSHWPLLAIAGGVYLLVTRNRKGQSQQNIGFLPIALLAVGAFGLLTRYGFFHFSIGAVIGPIILLFIGLHLFRPNGRFCRRGNKQREDNALEHLHTDITHRQAADEQAEAADTSHEKSEYRAGEDNRIDIFTILGGGNYSTRSTNLKSGSVVCIMGGAEIDVREADMQGDVLELDILAFMGGAEIKIPAHWQVTVKALPLLGGVSNRTTCLADKMGVPKKTLVITGLALMGGIEVRN